MGNRLAGHKDLLRQLFLGETMFFPQFTKYIFGRHTATSFFSIFYPGLSPAGDRGTVLSVPFCKFWAGGCVGAGTARPQALAG